MSLSLTSKDAVNEFNFIFPVRELESETVKLIPFTSEHGQEFFDKIKDHQELFKWYPPGPYKTFQELQQDLLEEIIHKDPGKMLYAIYDKSSGTPRLAGKIGFLFGDAVNQSIEIGFVMILPDFQRTHVATNGVGLLLHYCLELPASEAPADEKQPYGPGLGLRRVQWQTHSDNTPSKRLAERMGLRFEGEIRWQRMLREGKAGYQPLANSGRARLCNLPGRHSLMLSMCWDDWELEGKKEHVHTLMTRTRTA